MFTKIAVTALFASAAVLVPVFSAHAEEKVSEKEIHDFMMAQHQKRK